jgi:hypothetical protein
VNQVDPGLLQVTTDLYAFTFLKSQGNKIIHVNPNRYGQLGDSLSDTLYNIHQDAHPVLQASSIFIMTLIAMGGKKLVNQITMSGMYLYPVKSR